MNVLVPVEVVAECLHLAGDWVGGETRRANSWTEAQGGGWRLCEVVDEARRDSARSTAIMPGGAASDLGAVTTRVGRSLGPYILAILVALAAEIFAQMGLLLCCVGVFATRFVAHCIAVHAFATAYRDGKDTPTLPPDQASGFSL